MTSHFTNGEKEQKNISSILFSNLNLIQRSNNNSFRKEKVTKRRTKKNHRLKKHCITLNVLQSTVKLDFWKADIQRSED